MNNLPRTIPALATIPRPPRAPEHGYASEAAVPFRCFRLRGRGGRSVGLVDKDEELVAKPQAATPAALPIRSSAPGRAALVLLSILACVGAAVLAAQTAGAAEAPAARTSPTPPPIDVLTFGDPASEQAHGLTVDHGEIIRGGLGEPARRLLPREPGNWEGGRLAFTLKIDPEQPNYVTVRLWGSDVGGNRLILYCEGKQIGYRHLGDIDLLDFGSEEPGLQRPVLLQHHAPAAGPDPRQDACCTARSAPPAPSGATAPPSSSTRSR